MAEVSANLENELSHYFQGFFSELSPSGRLISLVFLPRWWSLPFRPPHIG
jgi:hypothetical protein